MVGIMPAMSIQIMEQARESLLERQKLVQESVEAAKTNLRRAEEELVEVGIAIVELDEAIERTRHPRARRKKSRSPTRAYARRDPAPGTRTHTVWKTIKEYDGNISIGVIGSKTKLPARSVASAAADLVDRDLIRRVSDGIFRAD
jgi:hypothetical protein